MSNKKFYTIICLLFLCAFWGTGCGSSNLGKIPNNVDENETVIFTVTFDSNGGTEVASVKVASGKTIEKPDDPTKENYVFAGWFKDNNTFENIFTFGTDGDKITSDITLYAQWLEPDSLVAEFSISEIVIGYAKGDNAKHVTQNLTLPIKVDSADITWTSNSAAISTNGTVTRQDTDTDVTLTATATYNGSNISTLTVKMLDEFNDSPEIPVTLADGKQYLYDPDTKIYLSNMNDSGVIYRVDTSIVDTLDVSAYKNMIDIIKWWKSRFDRNSLDGQGGVLNVIAHASESFTKLSKNNAGWLYPNRILVTEYESPFIRSQGAALDSMAHESAHGVFDYIVGTDDYFPYKNATGAIDEGYADIFGCIIEENWKIAEKTLDASSGFDCEKNIEKPGDSKAFFKGPEKIGGDRYFDYNAKEWHFLIWGNDPNEDDGGVHTNSFIISHAAYLMPQANDPTNGLSWEELGNVWYKSMSLGNYDATTEWGDVRSAVVKAAIEDMKLNDAKIKCIEKAFDDVGITSNSVNLKGRVTDANTGQALSGYTINALTSAKASSKSSGSLLDKLLYAVRTFFNNTFSMKISKGTYTVIVSKEGYQPYTTEIAIGDKDVELNVALSNTGVPVAIRDIPITSAYFPDDDFRTCCSYFDDNKDGILSFEERETVTWIHLMYNNSYPFTSLKGIEYFPALISLDVDTGNTPTLSSVDLSHNTKLKYLWLFTDIKELDLTNNTELEHLECYSTLTSLKINNCTNLRTLICGYNLPTIDLSANTELETLDLEAEKLTGIDLKGHSKLKYLRCFWIPNMISMDLTDCTGLEEINCNNAWGSSGLMNITLKNCTSLVSADFRANQFISLDLSECPAVKFLNCSENRLKSLKLQSNSLEELSCFSNDLTSLNLKCPALVNLYCFENNLSALDLSACPALKLIMCNENKLVSLNVSKCLSLSILNCSSNDLTELDLSNCTRLSDIDCSCNSLMELNITSCNEISYLHCNNNSLAELDLGEANSLVHLHCQNNKLTSLDISNNSSLSQLHCYGNQIETLDISNCPELMEWWPYSVKCDNGVIVVADSWVVVVGKNENAYSSNEYRPTNSHSSTNNTDNTLIVATLPEFTPNRTGEYSFDVSLDRTLSRDSKLFFLSSSKDLQGVFTIPDSESFDRVGVLAQLEAGKKYFPVIAAESESESENNSGGCNADILGISILFAGIILMKKR